MGAALAPGTSQTNMLVCEVLDGGGLSTTVEERLLSDHKVGEEWVERLNKPLNLRGIVKISRKVQRVA